MTLQELKSAITDLRFKCEELEEEANNIWRETDNDEEGEIADWLGNELNGISYQLSNLEDEFDNNED
jgi:hypothetical protein